MAKIYPEEIMYIQLFESATLSMETVSGNELI